MLLCWLAALTPPSHTRQALGSIRRPAPRKTTPAQHGALPTAHTVRRPPAGGAAAGRASAASPAAPIAGPQRALAVARAPVNAKGEALFYDAHGKPVAATAGKRFAQELSVE